MASVKYTFSISEDTLNAKIDNLRLENEIRNSQIVIALDYIETSSDVLDIWFKSELTSNDITTLNTLISQHTGDPWQTDLLKTFDKKLLVQATARPIGTFVCFTSSGDRQEYPYDIGGGTDMNLHHQIGDNLRQVLYCDLNVLQNKTYMREGYCIFKNCNFDNVRLDVVPKVTPYTLSQNTNFVSFAGIFALPAQGDGDIAINTNDIQLIANPKNLDDYTKKQSFGFWDADFNKTTQTFENIRPNLLGSGDYNIAISEFVIGTIADIHLLGDGAISLTTTDVVEICHGARIKLCFETLGDDHEWKTSVSLKLSRQFTNKANF